MGGPGGRRSVLVPMLELTGQSCGEGRVAHSSNAILCRLCDALITGQLRADVFYFVNVIFL